MKRVVVMFSIFLLILLLFSVFFWFYEARYFVGRASVSKQSFSVDNSYLFVSPLKANANGREKIRISVFILNNQGLGVMGKKVELGKSPNLKINIIQGLTDNYGKAIFDVSSEKQGEYYLEVTTEKTILPQKAHLSFN